MPLVTRIFFRQKEYQEYFDRYRELRKAVLEKQKNEKEHRARIEMLAFQIAEIEAASLKTGEDLALMKERDKLLNHKQIADTLTNAYVMLDNEDFSSLSNVRSAMNDLNLLKSMILIIKNSLIICQKPTMSLRMSLNS